jgi:hypothetical protein
VSIGSPFEGGMLRLEQYYGLRISATWQSSCSKPRSRWGRGARGSAASVGVGQSYRWGSRAGMLRARLRSGELGGSRLLGCKYSCSSRAWLA